MKKLCVSIIMGSNSDMPIMKQAAEILDFFDIGYEIDIVSAHRTPQKLFHYAANAHKRDIQVIIAGAGGAAHLPGMVAAISPLPVIGVPIKSSNSIDGWDSVLSILQMPNGVPVATVALNGSKNAGILAAQIVSVGNPEIREKIINYKKYLEKQVIDAASAIDRSGKDGFFNGGTLVIASRHSKETIIAPLCEREPGVRCIVAEDSIVVSGQKTLENPR
ncbi:MAG: 5-(carboxyamino)imidazole ribonucleotide mutase [Candidatus Cloacimonadaceae bacterium]|nr:5-(carboxyamino)imidazole ribonucleotide mutase [Candidatus Cloacimonadaceae bacterium]MDP3113800.1 5-(carboxyamino)imidazole ribonucleotide mutase [Candidatus Cloacimonadaceae bacterium]